MTTSRPLQPRDPKGRFLPYPRHHGTWTGYRRFRCRCKACTQAYKKTLKARKHGTSTNYKEGCRCAACTKEMKIYQAELRSRRAGTLGKKAKQHGTIMGYDHYKCRCVKCKAAQAVESRKRYVKTKKAA